jgi:GNAT superfamily N-acetyltransferase
VPDVEIREYVDADEMAVLDLLAASLGKSVDDRYRAFFRWKHLENPFGRSFMWVGAVDGQIVGFRSFLRWRFTGLGEEKVEAARAVDTATHPAAQGKGVFRSLTMHALEELRAAGVSFVFNTPNDQSRPGYRKMGWVVVGRAPVQVRLSSLGGAVRTARARQAAELWSLPTELGRSASEALEQSDEVGPARTGRDELVTDRSRAFLRWRYAGFAPVASQVAEAERGVGILFRLRRRGGATECTIGDVLGRPDDRAVGDAVRSVLRSGVADYALAGSPAMGRLPGFIPTRRLGPILTWRSTEGPGGAPPPFALALGDLELF